MRDQMAEWLRRWTANPLGFPRVSSNLILIDIFSFFTVKLKSAFVIWCCCCEKKTHEILAFLYDNFSSQLRVALL